MTDEADETGSDAEGAAATTEERDEDGRPEPPETFEPTTRTSITELFGDSDRVKLLDVFVATNQSALSASEVAEFGGIDISTVRSSLDVFLENDVIEETGTIGYSPMYSLNEDNEVAQAIDELSMALDDQMSEDEEDEPDERWGDAEAESEGPATDADDGGAWSSR